VIKIDTVDPQAPAHMDDDEALLLLPNDHAEHKCSQRATDVVWLTRMAQWSMILCVLQVVCGYLSRSLAMIGDCPHAFVDCVVFWLNVFAERQKTVYPEREEYWDLLGSLLSVGLLVPTVVIIFKESYAVLQEEVPGEEIEGLVMFCFCVVSTVGNLWMVYRYLHDTHPDFFLHQAIHPGCPHSHGKKPGLGGGLNASIAWIHFLADSFRTLCLSVAAIIILFGLAPSRIVDAIAAAVVGVCILVGMVSLSTAASDLVVAIQSRWVTMGAAVNSRRTSYDSA